MKEILQKIESEVEKRNIEESEIAEVLSFYDPAKQRRIIGGYASVSVVDREGHRITIPALKNAVAKFMGEDKFRLVQIFHSDIAVGRILPKWTNPETGETLLSEVNDIGWWVIVEIRDDIEIADKVWDEILAGRIKSFSIAGSSKDKAPSWEGGQQHTAINDLEIYETTLCTPFFTRIWTKNGLKQIIDICVGDEVLTHMLNWKPVVNVLNRSINEKIIKITTENGEVFFTKEHPIRVLLHNGCYNKYDWKMSEEIEQNDLISMHETRGNCQYCGIPIFKNEKYCNQKCHYSAPGNRLGSHYESKLKGITKKENPNLSGGFKTKEGKIKQQLAHQTPEFCRARKEIQTKLWQDPEYKRSQSKKIHSRRKELGIYKKHSKYMKELWSDKEYVKKILTIWKKRPNKLEQLLDNYLQETLPNEWKYVGCGDFLIESKNPDFININGQKKIIELNGVYWHKNKKETKERIKLFKSYGYETLIITDKELKKEPVECLNKIKEFAQNKLSKVIKVEEIPYKGLVYNLEVADDNSYVTEFAVAHNCETPVNQLSKFMVLWDPNKVSI